MYSHEDERASVEKDAVKQETCSVGDKQPVTDSASYKQCVLIFMSYVAL